MWKTVNYAVQGRGHERDNIPCQDKTLVMAKNGVQVIALADGAGSARYSHFGAEAALNAIGTFIADHFDVLINSPDGVNVKETIIQEAQEALTAEAQRLDCDYRDLASTLLLIAVKDEFFMLIHIGDGVIGYVKNQDLLIASMPENGEFANSTYFLTSPGVVAKTKLAKGKTAGIQGFVLMSDGTAESFYHKRTRTLAPALKKMIRWTALLSPDYMHSLIADSFNRMVKLNTLDDCSIAIIALSSGKDYFQLSREERCQLLGINPSYPLRARKQLERYDNILSLLQTPKTLPAVAGAIHLNPKQTKKRLRRLVKTGLVQQKGPYYRGLDYQPKTNRC